MLLTKVFIVGIHLDRYVRWYSTYDKVEYEQLLLDLWASMLFIKKIVGVVGLK